MKRPNAAGTVLQALEPLAKKMTEMEQLALAGGAMSVVQMGAQLTEASREASRRAVELVLDQAARSAPTSSACACGGRAESQGFEAISFIMRFGRVRVGRRRCRCDDCKRTGMPLDEAWSLPEGDYADDVREATERLACRLGYGEAMEQLQALWGIAPAASTAQRWVVEDGQRAQQAVRSDAKQHWAGYEKQQEAIGMGDLRALERVAGFGVVELDGVMVLTWKPGQESRRSLAANANTDPAPEANSETSTSSALSGPEPKAPERPSNPAAASPCSCEQGESCRLAQALPANTNVDAPLKAPCETTGSGVVSTPEPKAAEVPPKSTSASVSGCDNAGCQTSPPAIRHQPPSTLSQVQGSPMGPTGRSARIQGREVCVGLAYLGEHMCEQSKGHGVLLERRYVVTLNDRESFWIQLHAAATAQGVLNRKTLVRLSDGGQYFIEKSAELFCDQPMVPILDIQHAKQHVWETGHDLLRPKKELDAWVAPHLEHIKNGEAAAVIVDLAEERKKRQNLEQLKSIDGLSGYLHRHLQMMDYPAYRAAGYPIASAAIESTNKRLVSRRCKQGGMIWSEPGLEAMLALRAAAFNPGAWQRLWPHAAAA
jgi:hypothetical protein